MNANVEPVEYVGFWARVLASLVDTLLAMVICWPFVDMFAGADLEQLSKLNSLEDPEALDKALTVSLSMGSVWSWVLPAVGILLFWIARQATPGKMLISARIVDANTGAKPTAGQLVLRYIGYYISAIPFLLGFVWVGFDPRKQGWHDKLAKTVVVKSRKRSPRNK